MIRLILCVWTACFLLLAGHVSAEEAGVLKPGTLEYFLSEEYELKSGPDFFEVISPVPEEAEAAAAVIRCGPEGLRILLTWEDGFSQLLGISLFDHVIRERGRPDEVLENAGFELNPGGVRYYIRPNVSRYTEDIRKRYVEKWDSLPSPLTERAPVYFRMSPGGVSIWPGGRYAGSIDRPGKLREISFQVRPGAAVSEIIFSSRGAGPSFTPLDIIGLPAAEFLPGGAVIEIDGAGQDASGKTVRLGERSVPFNYQDSMWLDIGETYSYLSRSPQTAVLGRSSFDGLDDSALITVPAHQYARAWLLCVLDDSPDRDPYLTARLTRFVHDGGTYPHQGRGRDALADVEIKLPWKGEEPGPGIEPAGVFRLDGEELPLWLVEVPLASGEIQDLIWNEEPFRGTIRGIGPYLDFELLGKLTERAHPFRDRRWMPAPNSRSGVRVLGITLEKTPVEMEVGQVRPGNIFHNEEVPEIPVILRPEKDGDYILRRVIRDVDGESVEEETVIPLRKADGPVTRHISLQQPQPGWYGIDIELWDADRRLAAHRASFALLGPDTRKAGYESPFGTWWFGSHHYGTSDHTIAGELLHRLGFRRTHINHGQSRRSLSEEILAPWKLTDAMIGSPTRRKQAGVSDEEILESIEDHLERFPNVNYIMIFHESYPWSYNQAPELVGLPPEDMLEGGDERWELAFWAGELIRENFPGLEIIIGNSLGSSEFIAEGLRRGFPEEYADYTGNETVNRTVLPEKLNPVGAQCFWLQREISRQYGYGWGVSTCYEYNYRLERLIGQDLQAKWYARDTLIALAYGAPYISTALLYDVGNSYQHSFWGGSGLCRRYPLLYPKKSYVAMSVLTRMLDRAELTRKVPTGSNSIYALEFSRPGGEKVYAVWTSRGTAELEISFRRGLEAEITDMYGRRRGARAGARGIAMQAGTAVKYIVSPEPVRGIRYGGREYNDDLYYMDPAEFTVINRMDNPGQWKLAEGIDPLLENTDGNMPYRTKGSYTMVGAADREKGRCIEIELKADESLPALMGEYAVLRLREPVEAPGRPNTLGVWVKGNSGWGQVFFEVKDANGTRMISCGTPVHNADVHDYDGRVSVNFDGWHFLSFPLTGESPIPDLSTGSVPNLWNAEPRGRGVSYPLKVTGIAVSLPHQALHLTEMKSIRQVLRFRDLSVYE